MLLCVGAALLPTTAAAEARAGSRPKSAATVKDSKASFELLGSKTKFDDFGSHKLPEATTVSIDSANGRVAAAPPNVPILATSPFVRASGRNFVLGNKPFFVGGTSWFNMLQPEKYSEGLIMQMLQAHWAKGVRVIRTYGHSDGFGTNLRVKYPMQPKVGIFSEVALKRFDYALYAAGKVGIRLQIVLTNFWNEYGGAPFYVNSTVSAGAPVEVFYTDPRPRAAFKAWLKKLTQRRNTYSGRIYAEDPSIFAFALCSECGTTDNYEIKRNLTAGDMVYNWMVEMGRYLKVDMHVKQMVTNGNSGYRAAGKYDPYAPLSWPIRGWLNSGRKGEDFARMLYNPYLDFNTIHVYAYNIGVPPDQYDWVNTGVIADRAALAAAANRPLLMEEYGCPRSYGNRDTVFRSILGAAAAYGIAGSIVWQAWPTLGTDTSYSFNYSQQGAATLIQELAFQQRRGLSGASAISPFPYACPCTNNALNATFSCARVVAAGGCCWPRVQAGDAKNPDGFCQRSCGRCLCAGGSNWCLDASAAARGDAEMHSHAA